MEKIVIVILFVILLFIIWNTDYLFLFFLKKNIYFEFSFEKLLKHRLKGFKKINIYTLSYPCYEGRKNMFFSFKINDVVNNEGVLMIIRGIFVQAKFKVTEGKNYLDPHLIVIGEIGKTFFVEIESHRKVTEISITQQK